MVFASYTSYTSRNLDIMGQSCDGDGPGKRPRDVQVRATKRLRSSLARGGAREKNGRAGRRAVGKMAVEPADASGAEYSGTGRRVAVEAQTINGHGHAHGSKTDSDVDVASPKAEACGATPGKLEETEAKTAKLGKFGKASGSHVPLKKRRFQMMEAMSTSPAKTSSHESKPEQDAAVKNPKPDLGSTCAQKLDFANGLGSKHHVENEIEDKGEKAAKASDVVRDSLKLPVAASTSPNSPLTQVLPFHSQDKGQSVTPVKPVDSGMSFDVDVDVSPGEDKQDVSAVQRPSKEDGDLDVNEAKVSSRDDIHHVHLADVASASGTSDGKQGDASRKQVVLSQDSLGEGVASATPAASKEEDANVAASSLTLLASLVESKAQGQGSEVAAYAGSEEGRGDRSEEILAETVHGLVGKNESAHEVKMEDSTRREKALQCSHLRESTPELRGEGENKGEGEKKVEEEEVKVAEDRSKQPAMGVVEGMPEIRRCTAGERSFDLEAADALPLSRNRGAAEGGASEASSIQEHSQDKQLAASDAPHVRAACDTPDDVHGAESGGLEEESLVVAAAAEREEQAGRPAAEDRELVAQLDVGRGSGEEEAAMVGGKVEEVDGEVQEAGYAPAGEDHAIAGQRVGSGGDDDVHEERSGGVVASPVICGADSLGDERVFAAVVGPVDGVEEFEVEKVDYDDSDEEEEQARACAAATDNEMLAAEQVKLYGSMSTEQQQDGVLVEGKEDLSRSSALEIEDRCMDFGLEFKGKPEGSEAVKVEASENRSSDANLRGEVSGRAVSATAGARRSESPGMSDQRQIDVERQLDDHDGVGRDKSKANIPRGKTPEAEAKASSGEERTGQSLSTPCRMESKEKKSGVEEEGNDINEALSPSVGSGSGKKERSTGWDQLPEGFDNAQEALKAVRDGLISPGISSGKERREFGRSLSREYSGEENAHDYGVWGGSTDDGYSSRRYAQGPSFRPLSYEDPLRRRQSQGYSDRARMGRHSDPWMESTSHHMWNGQHHPRPPYMRHGQAVALPPYVDAAVAPYMISGRGGGGSHPNAAAVAAAKLESSGFVVAPDGTIVRAGDAAGVGGSRAMARGGYPARSGGGGAGFFAVTRYADRSAARGLGTVAALGRSLSARLGPSAADMASPSYGAHHAAMGYGGRPPYRVDVGDYRSGGRGADFYEWHRQSTSPSGRDRRPADGLDVDRRRYSGEEHGSYHGYSRSRSRGPSSPARRSEGSGRHGWTERSSSQSPGRAPADLGAEDAKVGSPEKEKNGGTTDKEHALSSRRRSRSRSRSRDRGSSRGAERERALEFERDRERERERERERLGHMYSRSSLRLSPHVIHGSALMDERDRQLLAELRGKESDGRKSRSGSTGKGSGRASSEKDKSPKRHTSSKCD